MKEGGRKLSLPPVESIFPPLSTPPNLLVLHDTVQRCAGHIAARALSATAGLLYSHAGAGRDAAHLARGPRRRGCQGGSGRRREWRQREEKGMKEGEIKEIIEL